MKANIESALNLAPEADLHFLTVWGDSCSTYQPVTGSTLDPKLVWTTRPNSTQAVIYKPVARDYARNKLIDSNLPLGELLDSWLTSGVLLNQLDNRVLKGTAFVPNIINFDISLATSSSDYYKLNHCGSNVVKQPGSPITGFIWFLVIVAVILFVAYCLIVLGPKTPLG